MKIYHPQISIKLIKAVRRSEIVPGIPVVQKRYESLDAIDLTGYLGDNGRVSITKSTRTPTGGFSIAFPDRMHATLNETLSALIEPMDLIEIRMSHDEKSLPVLMRGFVSNVIRNESMRGQRPMRMVNVVGHDFAKILQIVRVHYLPFTQASENILNVFKFFAQYAGAQNAKQMPASDFVADMLKYIINPYMKQISILSNGQSVSAKVINEWESIVSVDGLISPFLLSTFIDTSLYDVMRTCLDVGVFNELYVEDYDDGARLVVRPVPFKSVAGKFIQGDAQSMDVNSVDIEYQSVSRSDSGVANYFWVRNDRWSMIHDQDRKALAYLGNPESFIKEGYFNSSQSLFGWRKMEVESVLCGSSYNHSDAISSQKLPEQTQVMGDWLDGRRQTLAAINQDNLVFETGSMKLRGNEKIKAGMYLSILRSDVGRVGEVYAHTVTHDFVAYHGFFTHVDFDRGTFFIERSRSQSPNYLPETDGNGAV